MSLEDVLVEKAAELVIKYVEPAIKGVRDAVARRRLADQIISRGAFEQYYRVAIPRHAQTKTILYRATPVSLYSYYVDLDLSIDMPGRRGKQTLATKTVADLFHDNNRLIITGGAGSGKSTLIKHLFLASIEEGVGIPIAAELRHVTEVPNSVEDFVFDESRKLNLQMDRDVFMSLLRHGRFVLFLDGFDELQQSLSDRMSYHINNFCVRYPNTIVVVTSRPSYSFIGWHRFIEATILPLAKERCLELVAKLDYDPTVKDAFASAVSERLYTSHESFLSNPLLAILMLMTFEQYGNIEQQMHLFYGQAFDTLYMKHDATKVGYRRHMFSRLNADDFRAAVAAFCVQTYFDGRASMTEQQAFDVASRCARILRLRQNLDAANLLRDLTASVCLLAQDGLLLSFTHRSFQEYFAAVFILQYAQGRRRELLSKLRARLRTDTTAKMVFDMNQGVFEAEFLLDALGELRRYTAWSRDADPDDACIRFILRTFTQPQTDDGVFRIVPDGDSSTEMMDLVDFVEQRYSSRPIKLIEDDLPPATAATAAGILGRSRESRRQLRLTGRQRQTIMRAFPSLISALRHALALPDMIEQRRLSQENAIDTILLRGRV